LKFYKWQRAANEEPPEELAKNNEFFGLSAKAKHGDDTMFQLFLNKYLGIQKENILSETIVYTYLIFNYIFIFCDIHRLFV
jgi:hypothetical protein